MRKVVGYEDRETKDGRMILPDALSVVDEIIPVTLHRPNDVNLEIGRASGFQREEFGSISFEIVFDVAIDLDDFNPLFYISNVYSKFVGGVELITQATIREICYSRGPNAWGD